MMLFHCISMNFMLTSQIIFHLLRFLLKLLLVLKHLLLQNFELHSDILNFFLIISPQSLILDYQCFNFSVLNVQKSFQFLNLIIHDFHLSKILIFDIIKLPLIQYIQFLSQIIHFNLIVSFLLLHPYPKQIIFLKQFTLHKFSLFKNLCQLLLQFKELLVSNICIFSNLSQLVLQQINLCQVAVSLLFILNYFNQIILEKFVFVASTS
ncbi:hypothetical protein FGO68_gene7878 [Halteria grandinella]|uniref:Uncharacterized protein n=1 Tax=Halteria grandinella TaxID=5974 RepID=A0A8J8NGD6_HALGN|nr:hypothetical protein FGO68_gene7878 [Halteria grandinella]